MFFTRQAVFSFLSLENQSVKRLPLLGCTAVTIYIQIVMGREPLKGSRSSATSPCPWQLTGPVVPSPQ